jgi:hypothetical protein
MSPLCVRCEGEGAWRGVGRAGYGGDGTSCFGIGELLEAAGRCCLLLLLLLRRRAIRAEEERDFPEDDHHFGLMLLCLRFRLFFALLSSFASAPFFATSSSPHPQFDWPLHSKIHKNIPEKVKNGNAAPIASEAIPVSSEIEADFVRKHPKTPTTGWAHDLLPQWISRIERQRV